MLAKMLQNKHCSNSLLSNVFLCDLQWCISSNDGKLIQSLDSYWRKSYVLISNSTAAKSPSLVWELVMFLRFESIWLNEARWKEWRKLWKSFTQKKRERERGGINKALPCYSFPATIGKSLFGMFIFQFWYLKYHCTKCTLFYLSQQVILEDLHLW